MAKLSFNEVYKGWRNGARKFSLESILHAALQELRQPYDKLESLKAAPWHVLLIVKWVCQDRLMSSAHERISPTQFHALRQMVWDFSSRIDYGITNTVPWQLYFRRLQHQQALFQRKFRRDFARDAALLLQEGKTHPLRQLFIQQTDMDVGEFLDLATYTISGIITGNVSLSGQFFDSVRRAYTPQTVQRFISHVSLSVDELKVFCRSLPHCDEKVQSEYYEFPALYRYPFLRSGDRLELWHLALLQRGMEGFVYDALTACGQDFTDAYGKVFERHVQSESRLLGGTYYDEDEIKGWLPKDSRVPDCLLHFAECNVIVEAKSGVYSDDMLTAGNSEIFSTMTKGLRSAIQQAWAAVDGIASLGKAPGELSSTTTITNYLLVVTSKETGVGTGKRLAEMHPDGKLTPPSDRAAGLLPLEHVYIISIEDFETIERAVGRHDLYLPTFLSYCVTADSSLQTSCFYMEQHIAAKRIHAHVSRIVEDAFDQSMKRLKDAIGHAAMSQSG